MEKAHLRSHSVCLLRPGGKYKLQDASLVVLWNDQKPNDEESLDSTQKLWESFVTAVLNPSLEDIFINLKSKQKMMKFQSFISSVSVMAAQGEIPEQNR